MQEIILKAAQELNLTNALTLTRLDALYKATDKSISFNAFDKAIMQKSRELRKEKI